MGCWGSQCLYGPYTLKLFTLHYGSAACIRSLLIIFYLLLHNKHRLKITFQPLPRASDEIIYWYNGYVGLMSGNGKKLKQKNFKKYIVTNPTSELTKTPVIVAME